MVLLQKQHNSLQTQCIIKLWELSIINIVTWVEQTALSAVHRKNMWYPDRPIINNLMQQWMGSCDAISMSACRQRHVTSTCWQWNKTNQQVLWPFSGKPTSINTRSVKLYSVSQKIYLLGFFNFFPWIFKQNVIYVLYVHMTKFY